MKRKSVTKYQNSTKWIEPRKNKSNGPKIESNRAKIESNRHKHKSNRTQMNRTSQKAAKIKVCGHINPSETTFIAPSENLVNGVGEGERSVYKMEWPITYAQGLVSEFLRYPSVSRRLNGLERTLSVLSARIHRSYPSEGQRLSDLDVLLRLISQQKQYCETLSFLAFYEEDSEQSPMIRRRVILCHVQIPYGKHGEHFR